MTSEEINRLCQTLENGKRSSYVYALCLEDGTPFYIGKGIDHRVLSHEQEAADAAEVLGQIMADATLSEKEKAQARDCLSEKIKTILAAKGKINRVIIKWGLTEDEAFMCESSLINLLRFAEGKKIQPLTNIANGHASRPEKENPADVKTKARLVETFLEECAMDYRPIEQISEHHVAFININKLYERCLTPDGRADRGKVKEVVRGLWRFDNFNKARQVQYLFALYKQRVVGVFHVIRPPKRLAEERRDGFPDFPTFPPDIRRMDRFKSCAETLAEARTLFPEAYAEFIADLQRQNASKPPEKVFETFQKRIYFAVDDNVPEDVRAFENCFPTKDGKTVFIRRGSVQYGKEILNF